MPISKGQHDVGAHGFNATLEDWGRFGGFIRNNGTLPNGKTILPDNWIRQSSDWTKAKGSVSDAHPKGCTAISGGITQCPPTPPA